jgi:hypothetical protein
MLEAASHPDAWGFKLPECLLILDEVQAAFPQARYVCLNRDPLTTVLRRSHMTARLDNQIGQIALSLAYDWAGVPRAQILRDHQAVRMARTTAHQLALVEGLRSVTPGDRWHEMSFESLLTDPVAVLRGLGAFCGRPRQSTTVAQAIDRERAERPHEIADAVVAAVRAILDPVRTRMGYV